MNPALGMKYNKSLAPNKSEQVLRLEEVVSPEGSGGSDAHRTLLAR